ncbi:GH36 C-terminal domain-containing protein [Bifidobacterium aesculapii]|uniref:GH36 C-terminal domain-containing protein n=1 Tax=Bifidobacterium aesculapii TaxID=1329411 RepID=UPI0022A93211
MLGYGVVAEDRSRAIIAHVQYEESQTNRGVYLRVPGLDPAAEYTLKWTGPEPPSASLESLDAFGPMGETKATGRYLATVGIRFPRCRPETIRLVDIVREQ